VPIARGDGADSHRVDAQRPGRADRQVAPQHRPPPARGQPAIREQQDHQRERHQQQPPARGEEHGHHAQRQVMTEPVAQPRVVRPDTAQRRQRHQREKHPAQRITGLTPRHDEPDERHRQQNGEGHELNPEAGPRPVGRKIQRHLGGAQEDDQRAQRPRGQHRGRQPGTAPRRDRRHRCVPRLLAALPSHGAQRYARIVPGTLPPGTERSGPDRMRADAGLRSVPWITRAARTPGPGAARRCRPPAPIGRAGW